MAEPLFIGIDGGGTSCRARLRDASGRLLGEGKGGPSNARLDPALVMGSILTASRAAVAAAGLAETELRRAHAGFGLAGANLKSACERLLAQENPFASIVVETDAYVAWLGAHQGDDGAILILGTGSCGLAVVGGRQFDVSGWGAEVGDEASGQMIGREAIRRALWAHDGRAEPTPLSDAILRHFDGSAENVVAFATTARPADYASFVPVVLEYEEKRDPLALAIVAIAVTDAAKIANRLLDVGAPSLCLIGGLADFYAERLPPPIKARLKAPKSDAMDGAILMTERAFRRAGGG
jgi:glucosamine kinase